MTINNDDKAVAAVTAPASNSKRNYKKREAIYETTFSFTDATMARVAARNGIKNDRRFDEKIPGLAIQVYPSGKITFFVYKNVNMYNRKKNTWAPNVIYKKMFVWAKNTGFNCEASELLDWRKNPEVVKEIDARQLGNKEVWLLDKVKHLANLTRIQQEARTKGQYGVAIKAEELKDKVQGFYVDRNLTLTKELSEEDITQQMKSMFNTREEYEASHAGLAEELFPGKKVKDEDKT